MTNTPRLSLPLLAANQAQASVTIDQALSRLDGLVQCAVISRTLTTPPGSPSNGDSYIVGAGATGAWSGHDNSVAIYNFGWSFITPFTGFVVYSVADANFYAYSGGWVAWTSPINFVYGTVTLTANATSTTKTVAGVTISSAFVGCPTPTTQDAANDMATTSWVMGSGQFTVTHASNARSDRTFSYVIKP